MYISEPLIMTRGMGFSVLPAVTFLLYLRVWWVGKRRVPTESALGPRGLCELWFLEGAIGISGDRGR